MPSTNNDGGYGPEDRNERSEERFRLLVESVKDYAIFMLDQEGRVATWNSGAERIKGYAASEIVGEHFSKFYPTEAIQAGWPQHELRVAAREGRFEDEGWRVRKDGSRFWANVVITALRDERGQLQGFAKVTRDLTQRRLHEESLRQSEERFRLLVEGVSDYALFVLDLEGKVATWNAGAERIEGYSAYEIIGQHFSTFYPQDRVEMGWPKRELEVAAQEGRYEEEGWRVRKDGSRFWANVVITALRDGAGQLRGFAKLVRDLSERKRAQALEQDANHREALLEAERNARIAAQHAAEIKDQFLATVSHELRTPLNAILGWTQILRNTGNVKTEDIARGIDVIDRNARAQVRLIEDLLDFSRIMGGRLRLDVQPVSLIDVVDRAIESVEPAAHAKSLRLEKILDPIEGVVSGDPTRLQQVVWNILSNAVKFTPKGGKIQVLLQRVNSHIELSVTDTGIGIAPSFLPHVFERFSQQHSAANRPYGGLGLGLAIAKQLVEAHGGSIRVKSAGEGTGASFIVNLPLTLLDVSKDADRTHPTSETPEDERSLPSLAGLHAMVVDDEADALELVARVLRNQGAIVATAASGEEALALLDAAKPDVIITDIGMPGMDGYQLMRKIRAQEGANRIPAIALTAFARTEDRKRAILAGFQSYIAKPFDMAELVIIIAGLLQRT
jgi:PAS domain S-box-containing protein